jgi:hypothetical protein
MNKCINIENKKRCVLHYTDNIVIIAENETDLQEKLKHLNDWCLLIGMLVNANKIKVGHVYLILYLDLYMFFI